MKRIKQKLIKYTKEVFLQYSACIDVSGAVDPINDFNMIPEPYEIVAYSRNNKGVTGLIMRSESGNVYIIDHACPAIDVFYNI